MLPIGEIVFKKIICTILIILLWAAPALAGDWLAIMEATPENRVAKMAEFDTQSEAQAHVDQFIGKYPDAFVHQRIAGAMKHWLVDTTAETLSFSPDSTDLDQSVKESIKSYAKELVHSFMADSQFEIGAALHLIFIKANGGSWTEAEKSFADNLAIRFEYIRDVYMTARNAIQNISNMTEQEKISFDPKIDVTWPVVP